MWDSVEDPLSDEHNNRLKRGGQGRKLLFVGAGLCSVIAVNELLNLDVFGGKEMAIVGWWTREI